MFTKKSLYYYHDNPDLIKQDRKNYLGICSVVSMNGSYHHQLRKARVYIVGGEYCQIAQCRKCNDQWMIRIKYDIDDKGVARALRKVIYVEDMETVENELKSSAKKEKNGNSSSL